MGVAALALPGGETVAALAAVNAFGDVVDPETGALLAGPAGASGTAFRTARAFGKRTLDAVPCRRPTRRSSASATTIPFEPGALRRVAIEAHDGMARAVRPAHTIVDGDIVFALAPGGALPPILTRLRVGAAAAEVGGAGRSWPRSDEP